MRRVKFPPTHAHTHTQRERERETDRQTECRHTHAQTHARALRFRVALGLVDGSHHADDYFGSGEIIGENCGDGVVGLLRGVRIAAEAQGPVVVGELDAQGARGVQVTDRVGPGQQVPGHVPQPGGGVDQVGGPTERGDLCKDIRQKSYPMCCVSSPHSWADALI